jgi:hypothetical protein
MAARIRKEFPELAWYSSRAALVVLLADGQGATSQSGTTSLPTPPAETQPKPGVTPPPAPTLQTRPVPLTYVVDPALLEAVATMAAGPYHVKHGDKTVTTSSGTAAAKAFLSGLSAEVGGSGPATLLALPYADPDVSAIVRDGADELLRSADNARDAVLAHTGLPRTPAIASWPPTGYITQPALDELSTPAVVLTGAAVPTRSNYTPTAVTEIPRAGGPVTAIVTDQGLQRIVTAPVHTPADTLGLRQRFLAETAMIVAEQPSRLRTAVIAPPHQFDPRGTLAGELLALSGNLPWVQPVSLAEVAQSPADATSRRGLRYPKAARAAELPAALVRRAAETADRVAALGTLLCATPAQGGGDCHPDDVTLPMERALLASVSATWRADLSGGRALAEGAASRVEHLFGQVRVTSAGTVTLLSQSGSIPVTIANNLTVPVTVRLHITTPNPAQLSVQPDRTYVIAAGDKSQQTIQAHTASAGRARFPIYVQLETPTGAPIGAPTELIVRSSSYGIIAVAITGGALAVLFGAVAVRLTRTALRTRRSPPDEPTDGSRAQEPAPASSGLDE